CGSAAELPRLHAHEVLYLQGGEVHPGSEQPALRHHPRGHPLLHHPQAANQRSRAPLPALPSGSTDPLIGLDLHHLLCSRGFDWMLALHVVVYTLCSPLSWVFFFAPFPLSDAVLRWACSRFSNVDSHWTLKSLLIGQKVMLAGLPFFPRSLIGQWSQPIILLGKGKAVE
ncbi:hypothetical protein SKAU_G00430340, partial [Synaphobranchus kaupii]